MSTHKAFDKICCAVLALCFALTVLFMNAESLGIQKNSSAPGYETRLFDTSFVHTVDIVMDDRDAFIESCADEEYVPCSLVIDNEAFKNAAIRAKGNTSLSGVQIYGNDRYSFKIEFDRYDEGKTYYGLDKLSLNNIIQDNTYMKDYLCYRMMGFFGVSAPLCSYVQISVNGEEWGLYLAVEGVEDAFLSRNYGSDCGELCKPDSASMGGGRGNGGGFDMGDRENGPGGGFGVSDRADSPGDADAGSDAAAPSPPDMQGGRELSSGSDTMIPDRTQQDGGPGRGDVPMRDAGGDMGVMGGSGVLLIYSGDEYAAYSDIFDNAKTDITDADRDRLIASLKKLNENSDIEQVVNAEEVIRYFVVHNFVCNFDSYTGSMIHNYYLYEEDGRLSMIPWDYNLAFGGFAGGSDATSLVNYPIDTPVSGGSVESRPMLAWIFKSEAYTALYHRYFAEFISQYFDSGYFSETIDDVKEMLSPYVESDPTKFCTYAEFEKGVDTLKQFCLLRAESVSAQLSRTIASAAGEQRAETLIDASALSISDMGDMDGMNGPGNIGSWQLPDTGGAQGLPPDNGTGAPPPETQGAGTDSGQSGDWGFGNTPPDTGAGGTQGLPPDNGTGAPPQSTQGAGMDSEQSPFAPQTSESGVRDAADAPPSDSGAQGQTTDDSAGVQPHGPTL